MSAPTIESIDVSGKHVLVRADLEGDLDSPRFVATRAIVAYLQVRKAARIKIIGHEGNIGMAAELGVDINWDVRSDPREKENDDTYAAELANGFDVYVNEAFATSHRKHTSIVALPKLMKSQGFPTVIGPRFAKELEVLAKVLADPDPDGRVLVIGGIKVEDKNRYAKELASKFSHVLPGGRVDGTPYRADKLDISPEAALGYTEKIAAAKTIVAAGVMGKYEDADSEFGTKTVLQAIAHSSAYKVAGGGDIEAAISKYGLSDKFDWISVGGGAMLEYLTSGSLPGLEALVG